MGRAMAWGEECVVCKRRSVWCYFWHGKGRTHNHPLSLAHGSLVLRLGSDFKILQLTLKAPRWLFSCGASAYGLEESNVRTLKWCLGADKQRVQAGLFTTMKLFSLCPLVTCDSSACLPSCRCDASVVKYCCVCCNYFSTLPSLASPWTILEVIIDHLCFDLIWLEATRLLVQEAELFPHCAHCSGNLRLTHCV